MTKTVATNNVSDVNYHENSLEIFSLIWLGINVDMKDDLDIQRKLRTIINHQKKFQYGEECRRYIETSSVQASIVLIVNDQLGIEFIPSIHELRQVSSIHVLCKTKSSEEWTRDFPKERQVAIFYMGDRVNLTDSVQVLFEIEADPKVVTTKPFADISTISYFPSESEVLFMLGSIFCLDNIICDDDQMWVIHMTLSSDEEHALREVLTDMKNSNENGETCLRSLGKLLWNMGMLDLADKYYRRFVNEISLNDPLRMTLFEELGNIASQKGDYDKSIEWHKKALDVQSKNEIDEIIACKSIIAETLPPEHRNSALEKQIAECQDQPELDLGWSHLTDQDMSIVAYYCLYNNKTLLKLNLSSNKIGEIGAHYLADALYSNNTLTVLNLENNQIGDKGARSLSDAIKHNKTLKELRLLDYTISLNVKKKLKIQDGRIWC
ncbi:unnamed protein product [Rotaria socialis]